MAKVKKSHIERSKKIDSIKHINDLNSITIDTLDTRQAKEFATNLAQNNGIYISDEKIDYVLEKLEWLIPFHIQLIIQELKFLRKTALTDDDIAKPLSL